MAAVAQAAPLWQVSKVYYHQTFHQQKVMALHEAAISNGLESPYADWIDDILARPDDSHRVTTRVQCGEYFEVRDAALKAHESPDRSSRALVRAASRDRPAGVAHRGLRVGAQCSARPGS